MTIPEKATSYAERIALDDSYGYDQVDRWNRNRDCSSLVIDSYRNAGLPLVSTYTGNMKPDFLANGFRDVTPLVNLANGAGLIRGDVLLNVTSHTAIYCGNGRIVHARGNELGGVTGGQSGDQTGNEISIGGYFNFPWDCVLRYFGSDPAEDEENPNDKIQNGIYTVKSGDTLWGLSEKFLGAGWRYFEIKKLNGLTSDNLKPGMELKVPGQYVEAPPADEKCSVRLPILSYGDVSTTVRKVQAILNSSGYSIAVDGDFGSETKQVILQLQRSSGISETGKVDEKTWEALLL